MAGRGQGERGESSALGGGESHSALPPEVRSLEPKIAAVERREARHPAQGCRRTAHGADIGWCACRRSAPLALLGEGRRIKGAPGAFQTIRAMMLGCLKLWLFDN
jgi:hypothetical protein